MTEEQDVLDMSTIDKWASTLDDNSQRCWRPRVEQALKRFQKPVSKWTSMDVTVEVFSYEKDSMKKQAYAALNSYAKFCIQKTFVLGRSLRPVRRKPKHLPDESERRALRNYIHNIQELNWRTILEVLDATGQRASACLSLKKDCLVRVGLVPCIRFEAATVKTDEELIVKVTEDVAGDVQSLSGKGETLLFHDISYYALYNHVRRLGKELGIKSLTPHSFRYLRKNELEASGISRKALCKLMGWQAESPMPERYQEALSAEAAVKEADEKEKPRVYISSEP